MSVFNVPVVIGVDEDRIAKEIESTVEAQVVRNITEEVKKIIYDKESYYNRVSDEPLRNMVRTEVSNIIANKEDDIIKMAAEILADKLSRTKKVKEMTAEVAEKALK